MNKLTQLVRTSTGVPIASDFESGIGMPLVVDATTGAIYCLVNGAVTPSRMPIVATGDLPAAATAQNGLAVLEDAGSGNCNVVIYAHGQRFRIDGGTNF